MAATHAWCLPMEGNAMGMMLGIWLMVLSAAGFGGVIVMMIEDITDIVKSK